MKKTIVAISVLWIIVIFSSQKAYMSKIHYEAITLQELIKFSSHILVVKKGDPERTIEEIAIHRDKEKYPPFAKVIFHYEVLEVLFGGPESLKGQKIDVLPAHFDQSLELHKAYHLKGVSESPIYPIYEANLDYHTLDEFIIFLNQNGAYFQFVVDGAVEKVSEKAKILNLIKVLKRNPGEIQFKTGVHEGKWHDYQALFTIETKDKNIFYGEIKLTSGPFTGEVRKITIEQHTDGRLTIIRHLDGDLTQIVESFFPEIESIPDEKGNEALAQGRYRIVWKGPMKGYYGSGTGEIYQSEP